MSVGDGGYRVDDRCERVGGAGPSCNLQPIFGAGFDEWTGHCGSGDYF